MPKDFLVFIWIFFTGFSLLESKEVLWSRNIEAQLLQSMFLEAYRGKWFPMSNKTMPFDEFRLSGGRLHKEGVKEVFTGWYAQFDETNEPRMLCSFVDGKKNGFTYLWDDNGTRRFQGEYVENQKNGEFMEWNEQSIITSQKNYLKNKLDGDYLLWYDTGKIKLEAFFKAGRLVDAQGWYPDGSPCPYSKVVKGRGVILRYEKNYLPNIIEPPKDAVLFRAFGDLPGRDK